MSSSDHGRWDTANVGWGLVLAAFALTWFWKEAVVLTLVGLGLVVLGAVQDAKEDKAREARAAGPRRARIDREAEEARRRGW